MATYRVFFYWSRPKSSKYGTGPTQEKKMTLRLMLLSKYSFLHQQYWHNFDKLENLQICQFVSGLMLKEKCIIWFLLQSEYLYWSVDAFNHLNNKYIIRNFALKSFLGCQASKSSDYPSPQAWDQFHTWDNNGRTSHFYRTRVRSLGMLCINSLTHSLTDSLTPV